MDALAEAQNATDLEQRVEHIGLFRRGAMRHPVNPSTWVSKLDFTSFRVFTSSTRPVCMEFDVAEDPRPAQPPERQGALTPTPMLDSAAVAAGPARPKPNPADWTVGLPRLQMLYKREDVRKDYICMQLIHIIGHLLEAEGMDIPLLTYNVLPTSPEDGLIEVVQNSMTITDIVETYGRNGGAIDRYLKAHNQRVITEDYETIYRNSLAAYTVITFLLVCGCVWMGGEGGGGVVVRQIITCSNPQI